MLEISCMLIMSSSDYRLDMAVFVLFLEFLVFSVWYLLQFGAETFVVNHEYII